MSTKEQSYCPSSTCSAFLSNITGSRHRNCLKNRLWSLDPIAWPSGRRVGMRQQTCATDKVNCEQADVKLPGTSHLLVMTNFVCSVISGNIKRGHCTASARTPSAERDFLQGHVPPVSLLQYLSLAPFTFLLIAHTQQWNTGSFIIKKWTFFNSVTDGALCIFAIETLEIKGPTNLSQTHPSKYRSGCYNPGFCQKFSMSLKNHLCFNISNGHAYILDFVVDKPSKRSKVASIFCQKSMAVKHPKFTT